MSSFCLPPGLGCHSLHRRTASTSPTILPSSKSPVFSLSRYHPQQRKWQIRSTSLQNADTDATADEAQNVEALEKFSQIEKTTHKQIRLYPSPETAKKTGKGAKIADFLKVFGHLLERPYGGGESVAKAGAVVIDRVATDAKALRGQEGVSEQAIIEILKFLRFLEMDMELVAAANEEEVLMQRLEPAKSHCRQAFLIADAI